MTETTVDSESADNEQFISVFISLNFASQVALKTLNVEPLRGGCVYVKNDDRFLKLSL